MRKRFFLWALLLAVVSARGQTDSIAVEVEAADTVVSVLPWPQNLQARMDSLLRDKLFERTQVGLLVYDLTADSVLYRHGERQQLRPASTMKLVTSITALDRLGGDYLFRTQLYGSGRLEQGKLSGDLVCVGGMDPMFDTADLRAFVESVRRAGIDTIQGSIVADRSLKDDDLLGEGWCWDDDNPVLSPLLLSRKDDFVGRFAEELRRSGIVLLDSAGLVATGRKAVAGQAGRTSAAGGTRMLLGSRLHTMDEVLQRMMKVSDNLYAEAMFYQLAASGGGRNASAKQAAAHVRQLLSKLGQPAETYRVADGSGLSLYNYVTPELEVRLLRHAYHNASIYEHLLPSLPIAGVDGTLKSRMKGTSAEGNVQAKTGTVTGVSALAGYLTSENGHRLCFSIINQGIMSASTGRNFQDRVCQALCTPSVLPVVNVVKRPATKAVHRPATVRTAAKKSKAKKRKRRR